MQKRRDLYLCKKFPLLFASRHADMRATAMCWGFECGDGWYQIIKEAAQKLEPLIEDEKYKNQQAWEFGYFRASQIKEKYGTLRFCLSGGTDEMYAIVYKAERQSSTTCEKCGKPGKLRGSGWYYTACFKHTKPQDRRKHASR